MITPTTAEEKTEAERRGVHLTPPCEFQREACKPSFCYKQKAGTAHGALQMWAVRRESPARIALETEDGNRFSFRLEAPEEMPHVGFWRRGVFKSRFGLGLTGPIRQPVQMEGA